MDWKGKRAKCRDFHYLLGNIFKTFIDNIYIFKVGKDVQELKEYEESLVKQYKLYIDYLSDSIKNVIRTLFSSDKSLSRSDVDSLQKFYVSIFRKMIVK